MLLLFLLPVLACSAEVLLAVNCGSSDNRMIYTKFFNYTSDFHFEPMSSISARKNCLPQPLATSPETALYREHRALAPHAREFAYQPVLARPGHYIAIFTMVETQFRNKGERVFGLRLGDELVHKVDLVAQTGYGRALHKYIEFQIRGDVVYLNGTVPALNAYNFISHQVRFVFEAYINSPKVEAFMLLEGLHSKQYLQSFLQHEQEQLVANKRQCECSAEKHHIHPRYTHRPITLSDMRGAQDWQIFSLRALGYLCCGLLTVYHERILRKLGKLLDGSHGPIGKQKKQ